MLCRNCQLMISSTNLLFFVFLVIISQNLAYEHFFIELTLFSKVEIVYNSDMSKK